MAICAVSKSRISPIMITSGSWRRMARRALAKVSQASLTGHLVLATLHTNDASSAVTRLIDMGVEPFLLSSSLLGVLAQRLVRKIDTTEPSGYRGRTGIFEMLVVDDTVMPSRTRRSPSSRIRRMPEASAVSRISASLAWRWICARMVSSTTSISKMPVPRLRAT